MLPSMAHGKCTLQQWPFAQDKQCSWAAQRYLAIRRPFGSLRVLKPEEDVALAQEWVRATMVREVVSY